MNTRTPWAMLGASAVLCVAILMSGNGLAGEGRHVGVMNQDDPIVPWVIIENRTELHIAFQINAVNQARLRPYERRVINIGNRIGFTLRYHDGRRWTNPENYYGNGNLYYFCREFSDINTGATLTVYFTSTPP